MLHGPRHQVAMACNEIGPWVGAIVFLVLKHNLLVAAHAWVWRNSVAVSTVKWSGTSKLMSSAYPRRILSLDSGLRSLFIMIYSCGPILPYYTVYLADHNNREPTWLLLLFFCVVVVLLIVVVVVVVVVIQTSEVNQGNNLEHDFSCVLTVLMFPVKHLCQLPLTEVTRPRVLLSFSVWANQFMFMFYLLPTNHDMFVTARL